MRVQAAVLGLVVAACASGATAAEEQQQSFKVLMGRGFKVVATSVVPAAEAKLDYATVMVTLQQDKAIAVCTFSIANWENMNADSLGAAKNCDVRFF